MVFKPELSWEFLSTEQIQLRSVKAMRNHVHFLKQSSVHYKKVLSDIDPETIQSVSDIASLPLTSKESLVSNIKDFYTASAMECAETVLSSGSTGKPVLCYLTSSDLDRLAFNEALSFHGAQVTSNDRVQLLLSMDQMSLFAAAYYRGLLLLGANTARIGVLSHEMHKHYFELLLPTVLVGIPSFLVKLGEQLVKTGFNFNKAGIKKIFCVGESIRDEKMELNSIGKRLQSIYQASVYSTYGNTELACGYSECSERSGNHSHPELIYTEIIDEKGMPVEDGVVGELVATPFGAEGLGLLRYRTGDLTFKIPRSCACGRNSDRIGPILGRKSQIIRFKGTTLYPCVLTNALDELEYITDYLIVFEGEESQSEHIVINVVCQPSMVEAISLHLRTKTKVTIPVLISNIPTINSMRGDTRKKVHVVDKRRRKF